MAIRFVRNICRKCNCLTAWCNFLFHEDLVLICKPQKPHQRIADFLGLQKNFVALLAMVILVGLGEKMAERFLPLYLMALGGGAFSVGLLNGLDNLLSALYSFPGGYASERLGHKRALLLFNLIAMAGYAIVIACRTGRRSSWARSCSSRGPRSRCLPRWTWWPRFCPRTSAPWASRCTRWCAASRWRWAR